MQAEVPRSIGRYQPFLQIGAGGMARVYLAVQRGPFDAQKLVVIKQLRQGIAEDEQILAMFIDEARIALRLNHPNVVHTYEVVVEPPEYYLAMEFLEGQSLLNVLRRVGRGNVPLEEHIWILTQVLAGLHYAHELRDFDGSLLGVVHRDVSPSNVVVCFNGEVKLVDFGIAKASGALAETQQGVMKGKLGYVAPEQCFGKTADARSDIYAVGVMLWEAMAGRRRSSGETWPAMLHARMQDTEPAIEQVWPQAPPELVAVTRRALHRDPDERYPNAQLFQRDLERYLAQSPRKVGAEAVSALLRQHFEAAREELHRAIETHLAGSRISTKVALLAASDAAAAARDSGFGSDQRFSAPDAREEEETSDIPPDDALLLASKLDIPISDGVVRSAAPPQRGRRLGLMAVGFLLGALGLGTAFLLTRTTPDATSSGAVPATANVLSSPAPSAVTAQSPQATATTIQVRFAATPAGAALYLDGRVLGANPFTGSLPRDGAEHELRVTAANHREERRKLRFDRDIALELALTPEQTARAARHFRAVRQQAPEERASAVTASPTQAAAQRPAIEPGMELRVPAGSRPRRTLDEKDPYAP